MKAVLVFCEGRHDVVFAQRSLGAHGGCVWVGKHIGDLPSPFGPKGVATKGLIARRFEQHALEDLTLQAAAHPPLPSFESIVENTETGTMFFMVRVHGQDRSEPVVELLESLDVTITQELSGTFDVSEYAAAFLFDANGEGVTATLARFRNHYAAHFGDLSNLEHGEWVADTTVPVGCFVFHKSTHEQTGTIEDHLAPMVERAWPDRYTGAERFLEEKRHDGDKVSSHEAERLKAIITVTGQFDHPGDPMSIIIGRTGIPPAQFEESAVSAELAQFLTRTPWHEI